ncbi:hypothetical protein SAMN02745163_00466 [Clostridium cavendishii DSM 21758]|uniref:Uncharacterized protein n=1 Tax=Clostridium cavendishii DSM 21758 TaxID=1121302 RepID=A0A1M6CH63_9CLOT|nr:DUF4026 domain-containing protein [Clostridium cavendishii]SHI60359.1 hypothetical protein SAMN02745163_00466 [Clostridium cavendishii DSM 21758]
MRDSNIYKKILDGQGKLPSNMGIIPYEDIDEFTYEGIKESLEHNGDFNIVNMEVKENLLEGNIRYINQNLRVKIIINKSKFDVVDIEEKKDYYELSDQEVEHAKVANGYVECRVYFGRNSLESYLAQLKILNTITKNVAILIDMSAFKLLSGNWLSFVAKSKVPPSAEYLYSVHLVSDDNKKGIWMHTHGLYRCGLLEVEMLKITESVEGQYNYLNAIVNKLLIEGMPRQEAPIYAGRSQNRDIVYIWLPWQKAIKRLSKKGLFGAKIKFLGDKDDRKDGAHNGPSAVLLAYDNKKIKDADYYAEIIADNPIIYINSEETDRMSAVAEERFHHFKQIFNDYKNENKWEFVIKVGCLIDSAKKKEDREHLWFKVNEIKERDFLGELINEPYGIDSMKKNCIYNMMISNISDWRIYSPKESYSPDSIYKYFELDK